MIGDDSLYEVDFCKNQLFIRQSFLLLWSAEHFYLHVTRPNKSDLECGIYLSYELTEEKEISKKW